MAWVQELVVLIDPIATHLSSSWALAIHNMQHPEEKKKGTNNNDNYCNTNQSIIDNNSLIDFGQLWLYVHASTIV